MSEIHIVNQHRLTEVQDGMTCTECRLTRDDDIAFGFFDCHKYDDAVIPRTTPFEPPQELSELNEHRGVWRGTSPSIQNMPRAIEASDNESRLRELNAKAEALQERLNAVDTVDKFHEIYKAEHYNVSPCECKEGHQIECIDVVRHMNFNLGNAVKYIWRSAYKGARIQDLRKAVYYVENEIRRLESAESKNVQ